MTIVEFLTARLDEEAAMAQAAIAADDGRDGGFEDAFDMLTKGPDVAGVLAFLPRFGDAAAQMIVWNTPRRVLADVAAKRAILADHKTVHGWPDDEPSCWRCNPDTDYPCPTLQVLVQPYSDHPDFDAAWKVA